MKIDETLKEKEKMGGSIDGKLNAIDSILANHHQ
jgi:hypothetical protein